MLAEAATKLPEEFLARLDHLSLLMVCVILLLLLLGWGWRGLTKCHVIWSAGSRDGIFAVVCGMAALVASVVLLEAAFVPPNVTPKPRTTASEEARRGKLEILRDALWKHAVAHAGKMPEDRASADFPQELWRAPDEIGTPYGYFVPQTWGWNGMNPRLEDVKFDYAHREHRTMGPETHDVFVGDPRRYVLVYEQAPLGEMRFIITSTGQVVKLNAEELQSRIASETSELSEAWVEH